MKGKELIEKLNKIENFDELEIDIFSIIANDEMINYELNGSNSVCCPDVSEDELVLSKNQNLGDLGINNMSELCDMLEVLSDENSEIRNFSTRFSIEKEEKGKHFIDINFDGKFRYSLITKNIIN